MSGGRHGKLGVWYEHDFVCLCWLRLLLGQVESVEWEPSNPNDEKGVDVVVTELGKRVAYQVKKKSTGSWSKSELEASQILEHARKQLTRKGGLDEYRLVTTTSAPSLENLHRWALGNRPIELLKSAERDLAQTLLGEPIVGENVDRLRDLASKVFVDPRGEDALNQDLRGLAEALLNEEADGLIKELKGMRDVTVFGVMTLAALRRRLAPLGLKWKASIDGTHVIERLKHLTAKFVDDAEARRASTLVLDERPEVDELVTAVREMKRPGVLLVHGAAGSGKSDVLARAVDKLRESGIFTLPLVADELADFDQKEPNLNRLLRLGDGELVVVIDQLDQIANLGEHATTRIRRIVRAIEDARERGHAVVIGCRSADALQKSNYLETRLHNLLHRDGKVERFEVKDLPEAVASKVLAANGVTWESLGPEMRRLVRRPICLRIAIELAGSDGWRGVKSVHELAHRWWEEESAGKEGLEKALDALAACMERDGTTGVEVSLLLDHRDAFEFMESARFVRRDGDRWKPVHQVLIDMRLASQIENSTDSNEVLEHLGDRKDQGFQQAMRLRLATAKLAVRAGSGAGILNEVFRSDQVRPILKQYELLGLRDVVDLEHRQALVQVVRGWLQQETWVEPIYNKLLWQHAAWVEACREWLDDRWQRGGEEDRVSILRLLGSVSDKRGDFVAERLTRWSVDNLDVLQQARRYFTLPGSPCEDSEPLFEVRLDIMAQCDVGLDEYYDWERLFRECPGRAARLLAVILKRVEVAKLVDNSREVGIRLPKANQIPRSAAGFGWEIWGELRSWWLGLDVPDLQDVQFGPQEEHHPPFIELGRALARLFAWALGSQQIRWETLVLELPTPLREMDLWLLFQVGAQLDNVPEEVACDALQWLLDLDRSPRIRVGLGESGGGFDSVSGFVVGLAASLPDVAYAELESWILSYRDPWTGEDEKFRRGFKTPRGERFPNDRGALAFQVLKRLKQSHQKRMSSESEKRLEQLNRKFEGHEAFLFGGVFGQREDLGSAVSQQDLERMDATRLVEVFRSAPESDGVRVNSRSGALEFFDRETLTRQISGLIQRNPEAWTERAIALVESLPATPASPQSLVDLHETLVSSFARAGQSKPKGRAEGPREFEGALIRLALAPSVLGNVHCESALCDLVGSRPEIEWPNQVVAHLIELAGRGSTRHLKSPFPTRWDQDPLDHSLLNVVHNKALNALSSFGSVHAESRERLLAVSKRLLGSQDLARRAAAAQLGWVCSPDSAARRVELILEATDEPLVAASEQCYWSLHWALGQREVPDDLQNRVQSVLMGLASSDSGWLAYRGGYALVRLVAVGRLSKGCVLEELEAAPLARRGAVRALASWLDETESGAWVKALTEALLDDSSREVGGYLVQAIGRRGFRFLLRDPDFAKRVLESPAGKAHPDPILRVLDKEGELRSAKELILAIAKGMQGATGSEADPMYARLNARAVMGLLRRLIEDCEEHEDTTTRSRALDAIDELITSRPGLPLPDFSN